MKQGTFSIKKRIFFVSLGAMMALACNPKGVNDDEMLAHDVTNHFNQQPTQQEYIDPVLVREYHLDVSTLK